MDLKAYDDREQRCRMLGHPIHFGYCRQLPEGRPCRLILDCWHGWFDVTGFVREHCSAEQIEAIQAPPKPKLATIVDLIEQARKVRSEAEPP